MHLHDRRYRRVLTDELAGLHEALRHRSGQRRFDSRVVELLLRQLVRGAAILKGRFERVNRVERSLIVRLRDFEPRLGRVEVHLRHQAAAVQLLGALERVPRVIAIGDCLPHRRDLFVGRRLPIARPVDPKLRLDLAKLALGAVERELQFLRLDAHEHVSGADLGSELHRYIADPACHFAADLRLIGREQCAGEVHLPLDGHPLHGGGLDGDHAATTAAAAATTPSTARGRGRLAGGVLARCGTRGDQA